MSENDDEKYCKTKPADGVFFIILQYRLHGVILDNLIPH
jgi:hypothetical protein